MINPVIDAAKAVGVGADRSFLPLLGAEECRTATEKYLEGRHVTFCAPAFMQNLSTTHRADIIRDLAIKSFGGRRR